MSDITLCANHESVGCLLKTTCKRYLAISQQKHKAEYETYDYWNKECSGYYENLSPLEEAELKSTEARERWKENF